MEEDYLEDGREMYVSLEEAISCPPSLFSTSSRAEKDTDNTNATKSAASGVSNVRKSVLYGWCDRCTIQSFMDTVLSLSLRKRKQSEHMQQQIQEQQQKQKQEQLKYLKQQKQQQLQQQQQNNPVNTMNSITSSFSENLQLKDSSKETASQSQSISGDVNLQDVSQRRPKVKKVMKGGVLVSMPCGTRQPTTGARPFENSNNAEKNQLPLSNYKLDKANNFGAGNILDDILARAKDSQGSCITSFTKMSQAEKRSEAVGDPCETSLGHESDCSVSSGGFPVTNTESDFNPANNTPKLFETSCGRPCLHMQRLGLISSESSSDNEILSSFDRIRSLQFHNDDVFTNVAETLEGQSSKQAASTGITNEDEIHLPLKKLQETFLATERTNPNIMPNEEQQNKDLFSEKHKVVIDMETSFKTINADENGKKRKEILDATSSSIETKGKRMKETENKASTASKTPQIKEQDTNIQSLIKTKRKGPCSINWKNINSVRVTRSMSHGSTGKSPPDTKTQGSRAAECFPRNTYEPGMEISEDMPSLISMVSDEVLDVTVVEKEVLKKRGGRKKKKKKKPNEWFLRNKAKEKELKNNTKPPEYIPPVCIYFSKGTCAKGSMCQFRHEKTKELCGYYAGSGECYKFQDGMCPNLHSEFPCKFFHTQKFCWNEDKCRFSHEPLTEEMRDVFDNYLLYIQQRNKQGEVLESSSSITEKSDTNEKFKEIICSVDKTGGSLSSTIVTAPSNPVKQLPAANMFKYPVPTESSGKSVNSPKVKRLCSLSSYKPQILPSLTMSTIKNLERSSPKHKIPSECYNPEDSPQIKADETTSHSNTKLQFLPGMFKER